MMENNWTAFVPNDGDYEGLEKQLKLSGKYGTIEAMKDLYSFEDSSCRYLSNDQKKVFMKDAQEFLFICKVMYVVFGKFLSMAISAAALAREID